MNLIYDQWIEEIKKNMEKIAHFPIGSGEVSDILRESINLSGKMIRSQLLVACATLGKSFEKNKDKIFSLGALVELTHLASLIHDDIVDDSPKRRGKESIQGKYGKNSAVYAGDFLMARIYQYQAKNNLNEGGVLIAKAIEGMCIGEIGQDSLKFCEDVDEEKYLHNIFGKTALLFETACYLGAKYGGCDEELTKTLSEVGKNLGFMFQLKDDLLDFTSKFSELGKEVHRDFCEGIYTYPIIKALESDDKNIILSFMKKNREQKLLLEDVEKLIECTIECGGVAKTQEEIKRLGNISRNLLKDVKDKKILEVFTKLINKLEE